VALLHSTFEQQPINRSEIPQELLDLDARERTNLFPWRGQFSPGLVELLLNEYSSKGNKVFDPFAGVGTTLFEAARRNLPSVGTEINPAALAMADTVRFIPLSEKDRALKVQAAEALLEDRLGCGLPLFDKRSDDVNLRIVDVIAEATSIEERSLLTNALIRAMKSTSEVSVSSLRSAFREHSDLVMKLPMSSEECSIVQADARRSGLKAGSIDLVITSPPYINVFNYHQNNRPAMELLGSDVLAVAKSEFGSNRKHRGNRFLTVIQYCLDMNAALIELRRVIRDSGRVILVVGRESNVRGVAFQNGSLVGSVAEMNGFKLALRQERKFKNMFGDMIYEDILHLGPTEPTVWKGSPRQLGISALEEGLATVHNPDIKKDLQDAIHAAEQVEESPIFAAKDESLSCPLGD
jgi:DNA methylase